MSKLGTSLAHTQQIEFTSPSKYFFLFILHTKTFAYLIGTHFHELIEDLNTWCFVLLNDFGRKLFDLSFCPKRLSIYFRAIILCILWLIKVLQWQSRGWSAIMVCTKSTGASPHLIGWLWTGLVDEVEPTVMQFSRTVPAFFRTHLLPTPCMLLTLASRTTSTRGLPVISMPLHLP